MNRPLRLLLVSSLLLLPGLASAEPLPQDAAKLLETLAADVAELNRTTEEQIAAVRRKGEEEVKACYARYIQQLQELQDHYARSGKLDEAVAIRDRVRVLKTGNFGVAQDPGSLVEYGDRIGKSFLFEVVGATNQRVYGTDVYTHDSPLATAAVHAGALGYGEKGVVRVTILPGMGEYAGTSKNSVTSLNWTGSEFSYKVEKAPGFKTVKLAESEPAKEARPADGKTP